MEKASELQTEIHWKTKLVLFLAYAVVYSIFYVLPNFHPFFTPRFLPLTSWDEAMPFLPWTFFIYLSDYVLVLFPICLIRDRGQFEAFARTIFSVLILCGFCFIFFPTVYPRPEYPEVSNPFVSAVMSLVAAADAPTNCFPSMHVATTTVAVWSTRIWGRRIFSLFVLWEIAICISTMTTKQHYLWDIFGGLGVGMGVAYLEFVLFVKGNLVSRPGLKKA